MNNLNVTKVWELTKNWITQSKIYHVIIHQHQLEKMKVLWNVWNLLLEPFLDENVERTFLLCEERYQKGSKKIS